MSQNQEYPEAWGVFADGDLVGVELSERVAKDHAFYRGDAVAVRIPCLDRLVREAEQRGRDTERERCIAIGSNVYEFNMFGPLDEWPEIARRIESGEQPGEGGAT